MQLWQPLMVLLSIGQLVSDFYFRLFILFHFFIAHLLSLFTL